MKVLVVQALSNGRYKSCVHRAVVNKYKERKSLAFFLCPKEDKVLRAPDEVVSMDGTKHYPDFTWSHFLHFTQNHYRADQATLPNFINWFLSSKTTNQLLLANLQIHSVLLLYFFNHPLQHNLPSKFSLQFSHLHSKTFHSPSSFVYHLFLHLTYYVKSSSIFLILLYLSFVLRVTHQWFLSFHFISQQCRHPDIYGFHILLFSLLGFVCF